MDIFVYYTELIGSRVYSSEGRYLGKVHDLMARTEELYPLILRFVIKPRRFGKPVDLPWEAVKSLEKKKVRLVPGGKKSWFLTITVRMSWTWITIFWTCRF